MARPSSRDRLLDAYEELLVDGEGGEVTLDAVAEAGAVSKGGVLYHFPSKAALADALVERLAAQVERDAAAMLSAPEGPVAYWVTTSSASADPALDRTYLAVLRLATSGLPAARAALADVDDRWGAALARAIPDPLHARLVRLVGDGIYLQSLTGLSDGPHEGPAGTPELVALLEALVGRSRAAGRA